MRELEPLARKHGLSIYQVVLCATLMHPAIHVAVVGIKTEAQIIEALGVMGKTLLREDYFAVRKTLAIDGIAKIQDASAERK